MQNTDAVIVHVALICYALLSSSIKQWLQNLIWNYQIAKVSFHWYTWITDTYQECIHAPSIYFLASLLQTQLSPRGCVTTQLLKPPPLKERWQWTPLRLFGQQWQPKDFFKSIAVNYNKRDDDVDIGGKQGSDMGHRFQQLLHVSTRSIHCAAAPTPPVPQGCSCYHPSFTWHAHDWHHSHNYSQKKKEKSHFCWTETVPEHCNVTLIDLSI